MDMRANSYATQPYYNCGRVDASCCFTITFSIFVMHFRKTFYVPVGTIALSSKHRLGHSKPTLIVDKLCRLHMMSTVILFLMNEREFDAPFETPDVSRGLLSPSPVNPEPWNAIP